MNKYLLLTFCLLLSALISFSQADTIKKINPITNKLPKTAFTKMYLPVWEEAIEHCLAVANAMPDSLYTYKPTEVSKTFAEQMVHIGMSTELLTKRYVQGMDVKPVRLDASMMTKVEIIELMKKGFAYTTNVIYTIEQKQLDELCIIVKMKSVGLLHSFMYRII